MPFGARASANLFVKRGTAFVFYRLFKTMVGIDLPSTPAIFGS